MICIMSECRNIYCLYCLDGKCYHDAISIDLLGKCGSYSPLLIPKDVAGRYRAMQLLDHAKLNLLPDPQERE